MFSLSSSLPYVGVLISEFTIRDDNTKGRRKNITFYGSLLAGVKLFPVNFRKFCLLDYRQKLSYITISEPFTCNRNDLIFGSILSTFGAGRAGSKVDIFRCIFFSFFWVGGVGFCIFFFFLREDDTGSILEFCKD